LRVVAINKASYSVGIPRVGEHGIVSLSNDVRFSGLTSQVAARSCRAWDRDGNGALHLAHLVRVMFETFIRDLTRGQGDYRFGGVGMGFHTMGADGPAQSGEARSHGSYPSLPTVAHRAACTSSDGQARLRWHVPLGNHAVWDTMLRWPSGHSFHRIRDERGDASATRRQVLRPSYTDHRTRCCPARHGSPRSLVPIQQQGIPSGLVTIPASDRPSTFIRTAAHMICV
jgi:hypothetical protein